MTTPDRDQPRDHLRDEAREDRRHDSHEELDELLDVLSSQGIASLQSGTHQREPGETIDIHPAYGNVGDWVAEWLLPTVERRYAEGSRGGIYWCSRWWAHPEALQRIYSMWREWEKARIDDTMSLWWRDHLDPHLSTLAGENGAFVMCSPKRHYEPSLLPAENLPDVVLSLLPEGLFDGT